MNERVRVGIMCNEQQMHERSLCSADLYALLNHSESCMTPSLSLSMGRQ